MSGRHSGRTNQGLRITALPRTVKLALKLAPRQINDEIALAKIEAKRKGKQLGIAGAFFGVAAVFLALLVIGLIVAAIMGLATIMPAWLAALLVSAVFLLIALIGGLIGLRKFKQAMPLIPEDTVRGLKYDLGIAKEGSDFDAAVLDPNSPQAKAAAEAKAAEKARAKAEKETKKAAEGVDVPVATEPELRRRLKQRREHLTGVRDELGEELDVKTQAQALLAIVQHRAAEGNERFQEARGRAAERFAALSASARSGAAGGSLPGQLEARWKPLVALAASTAVLVALLRRLFKS